MLTFTETDAAWDTAYASLVGLCAADNYNAAGNGIVLLTIPKATITRTA